MSEFERIAIAASLLVGLLIPIGLAVVYGRAIALALSMVLIAILMTIIGGQLVISHCVSGRSTLE